jgi:hypothetical protein
MKGIRMNRHKVWTFVVIALTLGAVYYTGWPSTHAAAPAKLTPVLAELFTSEGCSDCPPADQVLAQLADHNLVEGVEVIAMSEHVDYWNQLGWSDPFSDAQFSIRQNEYAQAFGHRDIYTPQMVVDGQTEFVGSNRALAVLAIARASQKPKATITLTQASRGKETVTLQVSVAASTIVSSEPGEVFLAVTENNLFSRVARGENRGKNLTHVAVVRKLILIGKMSAGTSFSAAPVVRIASLWKAKDLHAIAFVQGKKDHHILAVSSIPIELAE